MFKSLSHFNLFLCMLWGSGLTSLIYLQLSTFPYTIFWRGCLLHCMFSPPLSKIQWPKVCGTILGNFVYPFIDGWILFVTFGYSEWYCYEYWCARFCENKFSFGWLYSWPDISVVSTSWIQMADCKETRTSLDYGIEGGGFLKPTPRGYWGMTLHVGVELLSHITLTFWGNTRLLQRSCTIVPFHWPQMRYLCLLNDTCYCPCFD